MLQYTKYRNSSHPQVSASYHTNKTTSNSQTRQSPNMQLHRWSHKDDNHYKNCFAFAVQLAYPVTREISGQQKSLTQQPYELLSQLHHQYMLLTFLIFQAAGVI